MLSGGNWNYLYYSLGFPPFPKFGTSKSGDRYKSETTSELIDFKLGEIQ